MGSILTVHEHETKALDVAGALVFVYVFASWQKSDAGAKRTRVRSWRGTKYGQQCDAFLKENRRPTWKDPVIQAVSPLQSSAAGPAHCRRGEAEAYDRPTSKMSGPNRHRQSARSPQSFISGNVLQDTTTATESRSWEYQHTLDHIPAPL
jgi:hypothetical protein